MTSTIENAQAAFTDFKSFLDNSKIPFFDELEITDPKTIDDIWARTDYFPGSEDGAWNVGVYFIFNDKGQIVYIGKASNNSSIGHRLSTYFKTDPSDKTKWLLSAHAKEKFREIAQKKSPGIDLQPASISVIAISDYGFSWIAPALEEYLIKRLDPPVNTVGKQGQTHGQ